MCLPLRGCPSQGELKAAIEGTQPCCRGKWSLAESHLHYGSWWRCCPFALVLGKFISSSSYERLQDIISFSPLTPRRNALKLSLSKENVFMYYLYNSKLILKIVFFFNYLWEILFYLLLRSAGMVSRLATLWEVVTRKIIRAYRYRTFSVCQILKQKLSVHSLI